MYILELFALLVAVLIACFITLLPFILIVCGILFLIGIFAVIYEYKMPIFRMCADNEIAIENVTFTRRNLLEEEI